MNQQAQGKELAEVGMQQAIDHANEETPEWSVMAYSAIKDFLEASPLAEGEFMGEEIRLWAHQEGGLVEPPHKRAWGGVIHKAAKCGLIRKLRIDTVKNPQAHAANAAVWSKA